MADIPLLKSPPEFPRTFVDADADLGTWEIIEPYYQKLLQRELPDLAAFETWLRDGSELEAAIDEKGTRHYVANACDTENEDLERQYLDFVENVVPKCKPYDFKLQQKFVDSPLRAKLPQPRYEIIERNIRTDVWLFRQENIPLETDDTKLAQQYGKICGAMTVEFDGREQTLQQMARYLEETDRDQRQTAWTLVANRRLEDRDKFDDIFDQLVKLRHRIARNAGFDNYRDYVFPRKHRFDYTHADCRTFHETVARTFVPAARDLAQRRAARLGVDPLRPWDLAVDPQGRPPLRPFETVDQLCDGCAAIFRKIDPQLADQFEKMRAAGVLDLDSRKGKRPGGFQANFEERRHPFIFLNAVGLQRDVEVLLHEAGHAFHTFASQNLPLLPDRHPPLEFCEVASMAMELLAADFLDVFYKPHEIARVKRKQLEDTLTMFPWIAVIDAFQHWIYTHPDHTREQRKQYWLDLDARFGLGASYEGYENAIASLWHRQIHLFELPFYYIEYGIAQLGALQIWHNAKRDLSAAVAAYRRALALGNTCPLPELYAAADIRFDFSTETIEPLIESVNKELNALPD